MPGSYFVVSFVELFGKDLPDVATLSRTDALLFPREVVWLAGKGGTDVALPTVLVTVRVFVVDFAVAVVVT